MIVFSENIERLNTVLAELQVSLSKQEELVKLNRESTLQIAELKKAEENEIGKAKIEVGSGKLQIAKLKVFVQSGCGGSSGSCS